MESVVLYKLFKQYDIVDVLPQIQEYIDEYNWRTERGLKRYHKILLKKKVLLRSNIGQLNSLINYVDKAINNFNRINNIIHNYHPFDKYTYSEESYIEHLNEIKNNLHSNLKQIDNHRPYVK